MFPYAHSRKTCLLKTVSSLMLFSVHIVWAQCRKPLKTISVMLGSIRGFGLICLFVIASFQCTLNSYFLLAVYIVCDLQIQLYICYYWIFFIQYCWKLICMWPLLKMFVTVIYKASGYFLGQFCNSSLPWLPYILFSAFCFLVFCLLCFLVSNNTLHMMLYTYICYWNSF